VEIIEQKREFMEALCKAHHVEKLFLFGSVVSNRFTDESDIDFLVQFEKVPLAEYFDNYMDFKEDLEKAFNRKIDLLENQAVKNPVLRRIIDNEKKLVYER
jgi:predicted nucleotidyltransferase